MIKPQNILVNIPHKLNQELFETLLQHNSVTIQRIVSKGHKSLESEWYDQEKNEWVMVIKGNAVLSFEDQSAIKLSEGDYINIPSHKKHKVIWTDPNNETVWLAVHY